MAKRLTQCIVIAVGLVFLAGACASGGKKEDPTRKKQGLTSKEVSAVVNEHSSDIRSCYKRELDLNPDFETKVNVRFMIGPDGAILSARPVKKKGEKKPKMSKKVFRQLKRLEKCVITQIKDWKFPEPRGGRKIRVVFPFVFKKI